jgi:Na+/alanine symporter
MGAWDTSFIYQSKLFLERCMANNITEEINNLKSQIGDIGKLVVQIGIILIMLTAYIAYKLYQIKVI